MPDDTKPNDRQHEEAEEIPVKQPEVPPCDLYAVAYSIRAPGPWLCCVYGDREIAEKFLKARLQVNPHAKLFRLRDSASRTEGECNCGKIDTSLKRTTAKGHDKAAEPPFDYTRSGPANPTAPFSDAEVEELAKVLHAERNPEFSDWDGLRGTDETGAKRSERECFIGLARACLRWFRSRPAPAAKGEAEEAGP